MLLIKTLRARDALHSHDSALSTRQRQILVLADGKRSSEQVLDLMGAEAQADIDTLLRLRYLVSDEDVQQQAESGFAPTETGNFAPTATGEMWDLSEFNEDLDLPSDFSKL